MSYLFQSERLGFRNWRAEDIPLMAAISADPAVMEHFPATATYQQTADFLARMQDLCSRKGYCYFAACRLSDDQLVGFIGLCDQDYAAPFTPCVDIGWRLSPAHWGQGYATEGARRCLAYAFEELGLADIKAVAVKGNLKSIRVMEKIGMTHLLDFKHEKLANFPDLEDCVCYEIKRT